MVNTILMDLDGTLLPFEQNEFLKAYFGQLCKQLAPKGYAPDDIVKAVWAGSKAMIENDGTVLNRDRFWAMFEQCLGKEILDAEKQLDAFYLGEFDNVKTILRGESCAKALVELLKEKGYTVVLATNPLFPEQAQRTRMSWVGLKPDDFAYVTHYRNSRFCKPNVAYYDEILRTIGKTPAECMMVGNSVGEDLIAEQLGMQVYFVNTYAENPNGEPTDRFAQGSLDEFMKFAETLPNVETKGSKV